MGSLKSFLLGAGSVLAILIGIGFALPSKYQVERNIFIQKPARQVFEHINTLPHWKSWAFAGHEEIPEVAFMGPVDGAGAIYIWEDDKGGGRMEIVSSSTPSNIQLKLTSQKNSHGSNLYFVLEPQEGGTLVHWTEEGEVGTNLQARYLIAFGILQKAIAHHYQISLQSLKAYCEQAR